MGEKTEIAWTHSTFNPWWGCAKVSDGCKHCYAEAFAKRTGHKVWGEGGERRTFADKHWNEPIKWNREAEAASERRRVFCASMSDVFEDHPVAALERPRLWNLIAATPWLDWLLLTKRPENMLRFAPAEWAAAWPANIWAGTTAEDQKNADARIPLLLQVPAVVRFVSYEPAIGQVDFTHIQWPGKHKVDVLRGGAWTGEPWGFVNHSDMNTLDWVIIGGESGHGARPFDVAWARDLLEHARVARVAVFVKQFGARAGMRDAKGGDMTEWPEELRVREFPTPRRP